MNEKLIRRRERMGLTKGEISEAIGISPSYYSALEYEQKSLIRMRTDKALKLAKVLNCRIQDIISEEELKRIYGEEGEV